MRKVTIHSRKEEVTCEKSLSIGVFRKTNYFIDPFCSNKPLNFNQKSELQNAEIPFPNNVSDRSLRGNNPTKIKSPIRSIFFVSIRLDVNSNIGQLFFNVSIAVF